MSDHDTTPPTLLDRRQYLETAIAAGAAFGLAGCSAGDGVLGGDGPDGGTTPTGLLSTAVSDDPGDIDDFESCIVTIRGIWVGPQVGEGSDGEDDGDDDAGGNETEPEDDVESDEGDDAESGESATNDSVSGSQPEDDTEDAGGPPEDAGEGDDGDGDGETDSDEEDGGDPEDDPDEEDDGDGNGRTYYEFDEPQDADLVELQGERSQLVGEHELEVATYQFLQLDVADISGTLTDGSEATVDTPGEAPLKFNQQFEVREGYRTTFTADFTPVLRGNGSYLFQPVASETEVSYQPIDDGTGDGNESTGGNQTASGNQTA